MRNNDVCAMHHLPGQEVVILSTEGKPAGNASVISFDDNLKRYKVSFSYSPSIVPQEIEVPESRVISLAAEVLKTFQSSNPSSNEER